MPAFLRARRTEGYVITALEQTANSVKLHEFEFPSKVVVVLGDEKRGVSPEILTYVDRCIEIPQFGLIR